MTALDKSADVSIALSGPGVIITDDSLTILTDEAACRVGEALARIGKMGPWLWADYIIFCERRGLRNVLDSNPNLPHRNRIRDYVSTGMLFAPEDRHPELTFGHHDAVNYQLSNPPGTIPDLKEAKSWLARAADKGWTVGELREAMRLDRRKDENDPGPMQGTIRFSDFIKVSRWSETVRAADLPDEQAEDLRKTTTPLFAFLCELHRKPFASG